VDLDSLDEVERNLAALRPHRAPSELRAGVLDAVHRELRAARWDRRLARAAMLLVMVGLGLNLMLGMRPVKPSHSLPPDLARSTSPQLLVDTAVVIAEATDASTGSRVARQLAAMSGHELTRDEAAAIDAATERGRNHSTNGNQG
jgi:hypothetical protein